MLLSNVQKISYSLHVANKTTSCNLEFIPKGEFQMEKSTLQKAIADYYLLKLQKENLISYLDAVEIKKLLKMYIDKSK